MLAGLSFGGALLVPMLHLADWSDAYMLSGMDANLHLFSQLAGIDLLHNKPVKIGPQRRIIPTNLHASLSTDEKALSLRGLICVSLRPIFLQCPQFPFQKASVWVCIKMSNTFLIGPVLLRTAVYTEYSGLSHCQGTIHASPSVLPVFLPKD